MDSIFEKIAIPSVPVPVANPFENWLGILKLFKATVFASVAVTNPLANVPGSNETLVKTIILIVPTSKWNSPFSS